MIIKKRAIPWWGWLAWILVIHIGAIAYTDLPPVVAGKGNRMTARFLIVIYEPALAFFVILIWHVLWRIDPKKRNYESFWSTYRYIGGVIVVSLCVTYLAVLGHVLNVISLRFLPTVIGVMFMLIANVCPRLQPNWWVGFRTPWTLSSTKSWDRTHRLGGRLGIPMGLLIIIFAWILPTDMVMRLAILIPVFLWVLITFVTSYFYAK